MSTSGKGKVRKTIPMENNFGWVGAADKEAEIEREAMRYRERYRERQPPRPPCARDIHRRISTFRRKSVATFRSGWGTFSPARLNFI